MDWLLLGLLSPIAVFLLRLGFVESPRVDPSLLAWKALAQQLGLRFQGSSNERIISGTLDGVPVRVDFRRTQDGGANSETITFQAGGDGQVPRNLELRRDSSLRAMGRVLTGRDHALGDEAFDELAELPNLDASICAALSHRARAQLTELLGRGGEVQSGRLVHAVSARPPEEGPWLLHMLKFLAQLSRELSVTPSSLPERLARNATEDPMAGVRLQNLTFLLDPVTAAPPELADDACRLGAKDDDPRVRLAAAQQLGAEGFSVLEELAASAAIDANVRASALRALHEQGVDVPETLVASLLASSAPDLVCVALELISARRLEAFADGALACAQSDVESVRLHAARALGALAPPGTEQSLLRLLSDASAEVRLASMDSLGAMGGALALESLERLAQGFGRAQLRDSARKALSRIQSRMARPDAGGLSLVSEHALQGALAVSEALGAGELALSDDEQNLRGKRSG